tara:strand:+ start:2649 stop:3257 length:609 start_codon:yes stop_codon:yes gene_type:complete
MRFSKFISIFFHPINFPIIGALLYFLFIPKYIYKPQEYLFLGVIFILTYIFPLVLLLLLKRFKMINSYQMKTIEERKYPTLLFTSISFILWNWLVKSTRVDLLSLLFLGYAIAFIISYLFLFFKVKISLHTGAIGGLIGFLIYFSYTFQINLIVLISLFFILSGLIASSRLRLQAHTQSEVFLGFIIGLGSQFLAYFLYFIT